MKKILFFAIAALALAFVACDKKNEPTNTDEITTEVNPADYINTMWRIDSCFAEGEKQRPPHGIIRVLDNNFGRNERQRKFLISLFNKVVAENDINQIFKLAENMLTSMDTNVSAADMVTLIFNVLPNIKELQTFSCPQDGEYTFYTTKSGAAVVLAKDMEVVAGSLRAFIYGE